MERLRKIAVATTTRADWGLLSPLAKELARRGAEVEVMAAAAHYDPRLGLTWREIEGDGFTPVCVSGLQGEPEEIAADCLRSYAAALRASHPDCIICLGDRYEMLSIAQAAVLVHVPVVHIAGGAISEGANDDCFRHAITKLSSLHLTECDQYRRRVISMGEDPRRVFDTGAIGVRNMLRVESVAKEELEKFIGMPIGDSLLVCTMHAATLEDGLDPEEQYDELLGGIAAAMETDKDLQVLFTYPNNDVDPAPLIAMLQEFVSCRPGRAAAVPSLGMRRYVSMLRLARGVIGNSSSGIVEVPSAGIPVLDIGRRQRGRLCATSVLHVPCERKDIERGINRILSTEVQKMARACVNPYAKPDTIALMADAILGSHLSTRKKFYQP